MYYGNISVSSAIRVFPRAADLATARIETAINQSGQQSRELV